MRMRLSIDVEKYIYTSTRDSPPFSGSHGFIIPDRGFGLLVTRLSLIHIQMCIRDSMWWTQTSLMKEYQSTTVLDDTLNSLISRSCRGGFRCMNTEHMPKITRGANWELPMKVFTLADWYHEHFTFFFLADFWHHFPHLKFSVSLLRSVSFSQTRQFIDAAITPWLTSQVINASSPKPAK